MQLFTSRARHLMPAVAAMLAVLVFAPPASADPDLPAARFAVTDEIAQPAPLRFGLNITGLGNGYKFFRGGSGFEPVRYRDMWIAEADSPDRIYASGHKITSFDRLATGALDGATVEVLRIVKGELRLVRTDRIAEGGHQANNFGTAHAFREMIPGDTRRFLWSWDPWNRPAAPYWFALRARDADGRLTERSEVIRIDAPRRLPKKARVEPELERVKRKEMSDDPSTLPAPTGFRAEVTRDGRLMTEWTPVEGAAGYVLEIADAPPEAHKGLYAELEGGASAEPIRKGDLIFVRQAWQDFDRAKYLSNRVWNARRAAGSFAVSLIKAFPDEESGVTWRLEPHEPGTAVEDPGETFLRVEARRGGDLRIGRGTHASAKQSFYPVLKPGQTYRIEVWLRADRATRVELRFSGFYNEARNGVSPAMFDVGPEWQRFVHDITPRRESTARRPGRTELVIRGPGVVDVDNFRMYRADTPFMAAEPETAERLRSARPGVLRTHAFVKTGQRTYDLDGLTAAPGVASGPEGSSSLPQLLTIIENAGAQPWLQVEPHLSRDEWLGLFEYLAAPFDPARDDPEALPYAAKRHAQGQTEPWLDTFRRIHMEIGNETWNPSFGPWTFSDIRLDGGKRYNAGTVYGLLTDYVAKIWQESPHWTPERARQVRWMLGGWEMVSRYGRQAASASDQADYLTLAPYIGGWESKNAIDSEDPSDFFNLMTHALQGSIMRARQHTEIAEKAAAARGKPYTLGSYESGPGYVLPGRMAGARKEALAIQERVMKSKAAASANLDAFLGRAMVGYDVEAFYAFTDGDRWSTHVPPSQGDWLHAPWALAALHNRVAHGDLLKVETREVPTAALEKKRKRQAIPDAPLVAAYATRREDRLAVTLISRRIPGQDDAGGEGRTRVSLDLPVESAAKATLWTMTGSWRDNTLDAPKVQPVSQDLGAYRGGGIDVVLDPAATAIVVLEGLGG